MRVIAEGVETQTQLELLRALRCDAAQGFLFDRPLPTGEFVRRWFRPPMGVRRTRSQGEPRFQVIS
jgi:EAL domain-containing protein (putative c-di-GMP-specific phosphodiesterase class I)